MPTYISTSTNDLSKVIKLFFMAKKLFFFFVLRQIQYKKNIKNSTDSSAVHKKLALSRYDKIYHLLLHRYLIWPYRCLYQPSVNTYKCFHGLVDRYL